MVTLIFVAGDINYMKKIIIITAAILALVMVSISLHFKNKTESWGNCVMDFDLPKLASYRAKPIQIKKTASQGDVYQFILPHSDLVDIKKYLQSCGYAKWEKGELAFQGFNFGWQEKDLEYSRKVHRGSDYIIGIDLILNEIIFIRFP